MKNSIIKKNVVRVAFGLVFGFVISFVAGSGVWAAGDDYVDDFNRYIFANGHAAIIEAGSESGTTRVKCDKNDNGTFETSETVSEGDLSKWSIFGGKKNGNVTNPKITMNSGDVFMIYAGGYACGGGFSNESGFANVTGVAEITVNGGNIKYISGGSDAFYGNAVVNKSIITVNSGTVGSIYANYGGGQPAFNIDGNSYDGDINNVKDVSFKLLGGNIGGVLSTYPSSDDDYTYKITFEKVSSFIISGASVRGYDSNNGIPAPTAADGTTKLYNVILYHELNGSKYTNKKIQYVQLDDGTKYEYKNAYTSNSDGYICLGS